MERHEALHIFHAPGNMGLSENRIPQKSNGESMLIHSVPPQFLNLQFHGIFHEIMNYCH
jgi:hypothetical protein